MNKRKFNDHETDCQCPICKANIESMEWKEDVKGEEAQDLIANLNSRSASGSYVVGAPASGEDGEVGIYFVDPKKIMEKIQI